jgi:uncharacterized protein YbjT (DUF2867 family)
MILVVGGNGSLGLTLLQRITRTSGTAAATVRPGRPRPEVPGVEWRTADALDPESLRPALHGVETLVWTPILRLLPPCLPVIEASGVRRAVMVSSAGVHTRLPSAGAQAKRDAEARLARTGLSWTVVRPTMIYGNRRDRNLTRVLDWFERCPVFPMFGDGNALMQPIHIADVVEALVGAIERPQSAGRTYDLGGAAPLTFRELLTTAAAAVGVRARLVPVPLGLARGVVRLAGRLGVRALAEEQVLRLAEDKAVDTGPARRDLGVDPMPFAEGIARQVAERRSSPAAAPRVALEGGRLP